MRHCPTAAERSEAHADALFRSRLDGQIDLRHPPRNWPNGCRGRS